MGWLWKREWKRWKKDMLIQLLVEISLPLLVFMIYRVENTWMFTLGRYVFRLPEEVYMLLGLSPGTQTGNILCYLFFPVLFLNVWAIWKGCMRAVKTVCLDEWDGSIRGMCNQFYNRKQLCGMKLLWSVASSLGLYVLWNLCLASLVVLGSFNDEQRSYGCMIVARLLLSGVLVHGMFLVGAFIFAVYYEGKDRACVFRRVNWLIFGTLVIGNLYKIRNCIYMLIEQLELDGSWMPSMENALQWMDSLYWLSPLSWMNPYTLRYGAAFSVQCSICISFIIIMVILGMRRYQKRNL